MECKSYLCAVEHIENHENAQSSWNFYIRQSHKANQSQKSIIFEDTFQFEDTNLSSQYYPQFIIKSKAAYEDSEWVMWKKKKNKLHRNSKGFWKVLNTDNKTPIEHLNCIKSILRDKLLVVMDCIGLNLQNKHKLSFRFINDHPPNLNSLLQSSTEFTDSENHSIHSGEEMKIADEKSNDNYSEYKLAFWNGYIYGPTSLSLHITTKYDNKICKRHFMHIPTNSNVSWSWYDNEDDEWKRYLDQSVILSFEASHHALINDMFPISDKFDYCTLPSLSRLIWNTVNKRKTFMFRQVLDDSKFEIVAVDNSYHEEFTANIKREEKEQIDEAKETLCHRQKWYSPFIVRRYIKYYTQCRMQMDEIIPMDIIQLCHKYYFQNVVELQFAQ